LKYNRPEAVSLICIYAEGIPRVINALCDNALLIGYALSKKRIDDERERIFGPPEPLVLPETTEESDDESEDTEEKEE